jgi:hypothetical protein
MVGFADCTMEETAYCIDGPGFERTTDGWLVLAEDGLPAGYATALGKGNREVVGIEVASQDPEVAAWLVEQAMGRAREMGRQSGNTEVAVDAFVYRVDEPLRALLCDHDFTTGTTYHTMRIDHPGPLASPELPAGVVVRRGAFDDATRSAAHETINECFRGQFGWVEQSHEEWLEAFERLPIFEWSQLTVLEVDGRAVAIRECTDAYSRPTTAATSACSAWSRTTADVGSRNSCSATPSPSTPPPAGPAQSCSSTRTIQRPP